MCNETIYVTKEGRIKLEKELKQLKLDDRPRIIAEIKRTRELGDLSENAEYHAAKEAQVYLERKIADMEQKMVRIQIVDSDKIPSDKVYLFATVKVSDQDRQIEIDYKLVPPDEVDIDNDIISVKSPIGNGLLGKEVGDIAEIKVPAGLLRYKILKISRD